MSPAQSPWVEPRHVPSVTFSGQRYDPLYIPPALSVGSGRGERTFNDVQEMLVEVPLGHTSFLHPPSRADITVRDASTTKNAGGGEKRGIAARLAASVAAFLKALRCV